MARTRTERAKEPALDAAARRRAFFGAAAVIAAAAGLMLALGAPGGGAPGGGGDDGAAAKPEAQRRLVAPAAGEAPSPLERAPEAAELPAIRAVAARFAAAFLARESGSFGAATRRSLRATATAEVWGQLRQPVRVTPAWRPPASRFEAVSGLSKTSLPGVVEAVVAFRRGQQQRYLSLLISREGGRWRATPRGL